jgi:putative peptidoglycan lipid II flippase
MARDLFQKSLQLLLRRQTNILSAAFVLMGTMIFQQILGLIRQRMLAAIFGASNIHGVYLASTKLPDLLFQLIIASALSSAFIPVFSDFLVKGEEEKGHKMASTLLVLGLCFFLVVSLVLFIFAPFFLQLLNLGQGYSADQMVLMTNLMRIVLTGQLLFIVGIFFSALLQTYNHFFIPGFAASLNNLGIIICIALLSPSIGIYAPAVGVVFGAFLFVVAQIPVMKSIGFKFIPSFSYYTEGVSEVFRLMWPRTFSLAVFQLGSLSIVSLISYLSDPGRNYVIFDYAQTLAFAPVTLFGQTIAQAAFPVLSREKDKLSEFRTTFITSFKQMFYLVLPVSVLLLVLRIPMVRLAFGASPKYDWPATVLTGQTLAMFSISIFAQALLYLVARAYYALHDTKTPLIIGSVTTLLMLALGYGFVLQYRYLGYISLLGIKLEGVEAIAFAYTAANILNLGISLFFLGKKIGGFDNWELFFPMVKISFATLFTGFALYIPIKLLDQLVFDTTKTINLLLLTGISGTAGLLLYLFLTWFFNVKEAQTFILMFKKLGNWREILGTSEEVIENPRPTP